MNAFTSHVVVFVITVIKVLNYNVEPNSKQFAFIDDVIARHRGRPGALLGILEAVQEHNPRNYLCADELRYIAAKTNLPVAQIFSVVTFYALFNLAPQGDHTICICRGTACHARGSRNLLESIRLELGLREVAGEGAADKLMLTTGDSKFTIRTVACFGQCALAPVVELDHRICGHMNERALASEVGAMAEDNRQ
jgi:NADH-quinone oxidoreductase subunit E